MINPVAIQLKQAGKTYPGLGQTFAALKPLDLSIASGEFVAVVGASGSGKSTLQHLLAGIDRPDRDESGGEVWVDGQALHRMSEAELSVWRGRGVGIVFQFFQLLPGLTAAENVMLPMDFCRRWPASERRPRALRLLERLGVADQADKFPAALSGGQQQRVAVARALANAPAVLLADEPTGNLDSRSAAALLDIFATLVRDEGLTIVMVTHERDALRQATRRITLQDGAIVADSRGQQEFADAA